MSEPADSEQIRKPSSQVCVRRCVRIFVLSRFLQGLCAHKDGIVGVFPMRQWHETGLGQLGLAPVSNRDFRRTFQVDTPIIRWKGVTRETLDHAATFRAANP